MSEFMNSFYIFFFLLISSCFSHQDILFAITSLAQEPINSVSKKNPHSHQNGRGGRSGGSEINFEMHNPPPPLTQAPPATSQASNTVASVTI